MFYFTIIIALSVCLSYLLCGGGFIKAKHTPPASAAIALVLAIAFGARYAAVVCAAAGLCSLVIWFIGKR